MPLTDLIPLRSNWCDNSQLVRPAHQLRQFASELKEMSGMPPPAPNRRSSVRSISSAQSATASENIGP